MKILLITLSLLSSSVAFSADGKPAYGERPLHCDCETCFTKYGVCTSVNQGREREDVKRSTASKRGSRGAKTTRE